ncbi:FadR/GntR family transcriptional regulator [Salinispora fenicalii]|uniref:FadR/GntR family transcriptional regulator n=1 Tax=Salinispora fenicalii TaxID=1137263 RepID=UPI0003735478|nr:FCD domain-containing protein [Salinispora fenicalii]
MTTSTSPFQPPARRRLADDLTAGLVALIHERGLQPGDQFDSVRELATRFQVAVPTLREALRRLEATSVIELRHGSGVYVGPNVRRLVLSNPVMMKPSADQLVALLSARLLFEPSIAAAAAEVREAREVQRMADALAEADRCIAEDDAQLWSVNLDFHRALAAAAGNPVIAEVVDSLLFAHAQEQREILRIHGDARQDLAEHRAITDAVVRGDPKAAAKLTDQHLQSVLSLVKQRMGTSDT